jgi:phytoene desaturase
MNAPAGISSFRPAGGGGRDPRPHAVVIGSGFGGLAAAVRLGARGYRVTVLERLDQPGGRASVFRQDGFTFDAGPTIVTAPFLFEELWQLCGRRLADDVALRPLEPFYRIRFADGTIFEPQSDPAALRREVARLAPQDVAGFERFMRLSEAACAVGFEKLGDEPFSSPLQMLRQAPMLLRLRAYRSIYGLVAAHVRSEKLRTALSFHPLLIGGNPFRAPGIYSLIPYLEWKWGVHFAMGGTGALVRGLACLVKAQGNEIQLRRDVDAIDVTEGRATGVTLATGERIRASLVVSNADSAFTYGKLLRNVPRRRWSDRKLARARHSMGLFLWYFGTKVQYPKTAHHTILLGPRYKGLLSDIFDRRILADDFSLYLHRPTATDPSLAPAGCDAFYVLSPVPHLAGGVDWRREAEPYRRRIASFLEESILPDISRNIVTSKVMTPLDFRDRLNAPFGAGFGLEPIFTQSAWFRPHNKSEDIENLYLVGAGTHPGAGLPGVLSSARILDKVVPDARILA